MTRAGSRVPFALFTLLAAGCGVAASRQDLGASSRSRPDARAAASGGRAIASVPADPGPSGAAVRDAAPVIAARAAVSGPENVAVCAPDALPCSETAVATRGDTVVVAYNRVVGASVGASRSTDRGRTFTPSGVAVSPESYGVADPGVVVAPDGAFLVSFIMNRADRTNFIGVARSTDDGVTFGAAVDASGPVNGSRVLFQDKPWLAVDTGPSSPGRGNVYVSWTRFDYSVPPLRTEIYVARSTDGGERFEAPIRLSAPIPPTGRQPQASIVATAPDGGVHVLWADESFQPAASGAAAGPVTLTLVTSSDGGRSFTAPRSILTYEMAETLTPFVRLKPFPHLLVDPAGVLQIVYHAQPRGKPRDRSDVFHVRSTDGGVTFSAPLRLNDDDGEASQAYPSVAAIVPANGSPSVPADGALLVKWWDRRRDPANDSLTDLFATISRDGGRTFGRCFRVTDRSWLFLAPSSGYHGDYDGGAGGSSAFHLAWSDERGSQPNAYVAAVAPDREPAAPDFAISPRSVLVELRAGESADVALDATAVGGFEGALGISLDGAPEGVTSSVTGGPAVAGQTATLRLATAVTTQPGSYRLDVSARSGDRTRGTALRLNVHDPLQTPALPRSVSSTRGVTAFRAGGAAIDGSDAVHVAYQDDTDDATRSSVLYRRSVDGGLTWSAPRRVSTDSDSPSIRPLAYGLDGSAVVAVDRGGNPFVLWAAPAAAGGFRLTLARSTDGGASFGSPVAITAELPGLPAPAMAVAPGGAILIAWSIDGSVAFTRADDGRTFAPPAALGPGGGPSVAFDADGAAYVVAATAAGSGLWLARDGREFGPGRTIAAPAPGQIPGGAAISIGTGGAVAIVTTLLDPGAGATRIHLSISTDGGASFRPAVEAARPSGGGAAAVALEPRGALDLLWTDDAPGQASAALFARSLDGGATFTTPARAAIAPGAIAAPQLVVDSTGRALLLWGDTAAGNAEVRGVALPPLASGPNRAPSAGIVSPADVPVEAGRSISFEGSVSDPDGDPVTVSWSFGDGASSTASRPPAHVYAMPGSYDVVLTVQDARGATAVARRTLTVVAPSTPGVALVLPVVLELSGAGGSHYTTEVVLASLAASPLDVVLRYTHQSTQQPGAGLPAQYARLTLAPGEQRFLPNVISFLRERTVAIPSAATVGTLGVTFENVTDRSLVFAGARTFTPDPAGGGGTFGLFYPAAETTEGAAMVIGLQANAGQRSNLALFNAGADPITLHVQPFGPSADVALVPRPDVTLAGYGWTQSAATLSGETSGRAVITRVSGTSPFGAYGVLNDNVTSDGSYVPARIAGREEASDDALLVPIVLDASGVGARFLTELTIANSGASAMSVTLSYRAAPGFGGGSGEATLALAAGEQQIVPDVLAFLRRTLPIESDGRSLGGSLLLRAPAGRIGDLAAGARTFVSRAAPGSFGLFCPGLTLGESAESAALVYGLKENASQRSNLALVNRGDAGDPITLRLTYLGPDGRAAGEPEERTLAPGEWTQVSRPLAARGLASGYARIERVGGRSRFVAYGVLNDNVTSDGSYIGFTR